MQLTSHRGIRLWCCSTNNISPFHDITKIEDASSVHFFLFQYKNLLSSLFYSLSFLFLELFFLHKVLHALIVQKPLLINQVMDQIKEYDETSFRHDASSSITVLHKHNG